MSLSNLIFASRKVLAIGKRRVPSLTMFRYELLKWDEVQQQKRNTPLKRELDWPTVAREIALMNKPYSR